MLRINSTYDEMGQVNAKTYGEWLVTNCYAYNERGWLKEVDNFVSGTSTLYDQSLAYDYNGNINHIDWASMEMGEDNIFDLKDYSYAYQDKRI